MWPLTGRAEELQVVSRLTRHRDGPAGVVLAGAAGVGKTRLAREAKAGVVIGVDDAHLLDELSAALVHQLVLRRTANVVLTLRTGEIAPDAVTPLWKEGHLSRLELQPLSPDETITLLEAALGGAMDSVVARRLWSITRGNVLYLRQLVDGELEAGRRICVAHQGRAPRD